MKRKMMLVAAALGAGAMLMTGCSIPTTASDEIAVHKANGPLEGKQSKGCVSPDQREINSAFDNYFYYPLNQRVFDFTGKKLADAEPITVVSSDNQILIVPGSVNFALNTDCNVLTAFHDNIGRRYQAYMVEGDKGYETGDGWARMMNLYIGRAADATLDRVAKQYTWRELYSDPKIKDEMNQTVNETIARLVNQQTDGDQEFFTEFSALIQQPIPDQELVAALKSEETARANASATQAKAVADAAAAEAAAQSQVAQKEAELKVKQIEAEIQRQVISAYGSVENYNNAKAIEQGLNPFQPSYGVPMTDTAK